jgi:hypothetical protein
VEQQTGIVHCLSVDDTNPTDDRKGFDSLSSQDQKTIEQVLFLLDKFCIGDSFYHELTMIIDGLPKSYLVKQRRGQFNDISNVVPTPGNADGAQISFTDMSSLPRTSTVKITQCVDPTRDVGNGRISTKASRRTPRGRVRTYAYVAEYVRTRTYACGLHAFAFFAFCFAFFAFFFAFFAFCFAFFALWPD